MVIKLLKVSVIILLSLITLVMIAITVIDPNDYKDDITAAVKAKTGRDLLIGGPLHFSFFDFPTLKLEDVSFSNADWAQEPVLASMSLMEADISLWALLNGNIDIRQFSLIDAKLHLETNADGVHSWTLPNRKDERDDIADDQDRKPPKIDLHKIRFEHAQIYYYDARNQHSHDLNIALFELKRTPASRLQLITDGQYQQQDFALEITTGLIKEWMKNSDSPFTLNARIGNHTQLQMNGDITAPLTAPHAAFFIDGELNDLQALSKIVGTPLPALSPISLNTVMDYESQALSLKQLAIQLDKDEILGELTADWSADKPHIALTLGAEKFAVDKLLSQLSTTTETTEPEAPTETQQTDLSLPFNLLNTVNADVQLSVGELLLPNLSVINLDLQSRLDNGKWTVSPLRFGMAGGDFETRLDIDAAQELPNITAQIDLTKVHLSALPVLNQYLAGGQTDASITLSSQGNTITDLENNAKVTVQFNAQETVLSRAIQHDNPALFSFEQADASIEVDNHNKAVSINQLSLTAPVVHALIDDEGQATWQFGEAAKTQETASPNTADAPYTVSLGKVQLNDAQLIYSDAPKEQRHDLVISTLSLEGQNDRLNIDSSLQYQDTSITLVGQTSRVASLLSDQTIKVDLKLTAAEQTLSVNGDIKAPLTEQMLNLTLSADMPKLDALSALAGTTLPSLAPITLSTTVTRTGSNLTAKKLALTYGESDLNGDLEVNWSEDTPRLHATLNSHLIDLTELPESDPEKTEQSPSDKVFPAKSLPFNLLQQGQGSVRLSVDKLNTGAVVFDKALLTAKLDNGQLDIKPFFADMAKGQITGHVSLLAKNDTGSLDAELSAIGLDPRYIANLDEYVVEGAKSDVHFKLKGKGKSIAEIMANADGKLTLQTQPGQLNVEGGLLTTDLVTALIPTGSNAEGMALECGVVNYTIKEGKAVSNKGIAFVTDEMNIVGSSTIDLKTEALEIDLKPRVKEGLGISMADLADLVSIGGTLKNPAMGADMLSTLEAGLKVQSAIATGGLSLLAAGLLEQLTADTDPCATALGIKKAVEPEQDQEASSSP